jgi:hypothetical protein
MTPTIEQNTKDFIAAMIADDVPLMTELPKRLADEDRVAALRHLIKAIKADEQLSTEHAKVLEVLERAESITSALEENTSSDVEDQGETKEKAPESTEAVEEATVEASTEESVVETDSKPETVTQEEAAKEN